MKICRDCEGGWVCEEGWNNPVTELDISTVSYTEKIKKWKCIDCDSVNVGEMEDGEMVCIDCDEEVLGIWKEYKGGIMTNHNFPMVKRLGLDQ